MNTALRDLFRKKLKDLMNVILVTILIISLLPTNAEAKELKWVLEPTLIVMQYGFNDGVTVVSFGKKWGIIDTTGKVIVLDKYDYIYSFCNGFAITNRSELIDKTGKEVISNTGEYNIQPLTTKDSRVIWNVSEGGLVIAEKDGKTGAFNTKGELIIPTIYDDIDYFYEGLALAKKDGKYGYIEDGTGIEVIPFVYDGAYEFNEGLAAVRIGDKAGYINKKGETVVPFIYKWTYTFLDGVAKVFSEKGIEYIDAKGNVVLSRFYTGGRYNSSEFRTGLAYIINGNGDVAYMNKKGQMTPFIYDELYPPFLCDFVIGEGIIKVSKGGKYGMLNKELKEFVPCIYDDVRKFSEGLAMVKKDGKAGYINENGKLVVLLTYRHGGEFSEGLANIYVEHEKGSKFGYIDSTGKMIIEPIFDSALGFIDGVAWVRVGDKWGLIENPLKNKSKDIQLKATPTSSKVLVNGKEISFDAYTIEGNNYFKLRDLATVVSGTEKEFEVTWDGNKHAINLISNKTYTAVGGEMVKGDGEVKTPTINTSIIYKDGVRLKLIAYTINGNNYFKLRDIAEVFDIGVTWDSNTKTIKIDTKFHYITDKM